MTQDEIDKMKSQDGVYIVGYTEVPKYTQLVVVLAGQLYSCGVGDELCNEASAWREQAHLVAGPLTVQNQRELNEKAEEVQVYVTQLEHDLTCWKTLALQMKLLLTTGSWQTEGTRQLAKRLIAMADGYQAPTTKPKA